MTRLLLTDLGTMGTSTGVMWICLVALLLGTQQPHAHAHAHAHAAQEQQSMMAVTARMMEEATSRPIPTPPQLNGAHFKVTIVEQNGFVEIYDNKDGSVYHTGYLIEVFQRLAAPERGNFTFELFSPSGYGSLCYDDDDDDDDDIRGSEPKQTKQPYLREWRSKYGCGQSDVTDVPHTNYTTDMYLGLFFINPKRQLLNDFTRPLDPPRTGTLTMYGTATHIQDIYDLIEQQVAGTQGPACVHGNTAYVEFLVNSFPTLEVTEISGTDEDELQALQDGTCDILINAHPIATYFVLTRFAKNQCHVHGKPIGIIGEPLHFGLNQYAIGIRKDIPKEVVDTFNYWLTVLMTCSPVDCPRDSMSVLYEPWAGTGHECGYISNPITETGPRLRPGGFAGIIIGCITFMAVVMSVAYYFKLKRQKKRFRKRFVQQIARNINIGPSPECIPLEKLAEEVHHIGDKNGMITKDKLLKWMLDVKLEFISDSDFNALWTAMDNKHRGEVCAIDFFVFLSACGAEFEEVYNEQKAMPKSERIKWAARRLSNINKLGEAGVQALQFRLDRGISKDLRQSPSAQSWKKTTQDKSGLTDPSTEECALGSFRRPSLTTVSQSSSISPPSPPPPPPPQPAASIPPEDNIYGYGVDVVNDDSKTHRELNTSRTRIAAFCKDLRQTVG